MGVGPVGKIRSNDFFNRTGPIKILNNAKPGSAVVQQEVLNVTDLDQDIPVKRSQASNRGGGAKNLIRNEILSN
jgi:hypothetical protein